jgi:hypothetical protein
LQNGHLYFDYGSSNLWCNTCPRNYGLQYPEHSFYRFEAEWARVQEQWESKATCNRPRQTTGYDFGSVSETLIIPSFAVTGLSCSSGYSGSPTATVCGIAWTDYSVAGCQATCNRPSTTGYDFGSVSETLIISSFAVTGLSCSSGYVGSPTATVCGRAGTYYSVAGCQACTITEGRGCNHMTTRGECTTSRDGRSALPTIGAFAVYQEKCVWCGSSTDSCGSGNMCEPYAWMVGMGYMQDSFQIACEAPTPVPTPAPEAPWSVSSGSCTVDTNGCAKSPNYPRTYENTYGCAFSVTNHVAIEVESFSTQSCCDYLVVNGIQYRGTTGPPNGTVVTSMSWHVNPFAAYTGWKICPKEA